MACRRIDPAVAAPTFGRDDAGFVLAVLLVRAGGDASAWMASGTACGAARLLLDVVILSLSPVVFGLIVTSYTDVLGPREVLLAPGGLLYLSTYVATAYAMFWVTRRTAFARPTSPQGLLAWGTLGVSAGAALHAGPAAADCRSGSGASGSRSGSSGWVGSRSAR